MDKKQAASYIAEKFARPDSALQYALELAKQNNLPEISIQPDEGLFLQFLVRICSAVKAVEVGTLGGYSGIWIARGLPENGRLISIEKEPEHASIAKRSFENAGLSSLVEIKVGDAMVMLNKISGDGPFDFVFIDADKTTYSDYFEWAMVNIRVGGVIAVHNVFAFGYLLDEGAVSENVRIIRDLNERIAKDPRLFSIIYPSGDGTLAAMRIE